MKKVRLMHCIKSVRFRSYSCPHFPAFGLNTERYSLSLRIQSECGKMWARITPNTDTFYAVMCWMSETFRSIGYCCLSLLWKLVPRNYNTNWNNVRKFFFKNLLNSAWLWYRARLAILHLLQDYLKVWSLLPIFIKEKEKKTKFVN